MFFFADSKQRGAEEDSYSKKKTQSAKETMGSLQIDMDEFKKMLTDAFNATFQPKFDRVSHRIDEFALPRNNTTSTPSFTVRNPIPEGSQDQGFVIRPAHDLEERVRSLDRRTLASSQGIPVQTSTGAHHLCFPSSKQSPQRGEVDAELGEESSHTTSADMVQVASRIFTLEWFASIQDQLQNRDRPATPLHSRKQSRREGDFVVEIGEDSNSAIGAKSIPTTPKTLEATSSEMNRPGIGESIRVKLPLFVKQTADEDPLLGGAIQLDSSKSNVVESSQEVRGTCRIQQFEEKVLGYKTPNFDLVFLGCGHSNSVDGGKGELDELKTMAMLRDLGMEQNFNWKPGEEFGVLELDGGYLNHKPPIVPSKNECRTAVRRHGNCSERNSAKLVVKAGLFQPHKAFPIKLQAPTQLDAIDDEIEAAKVVPKKMFEQATFDPIWDRFCDDFDKRKDQALRSKLFEEGGSLI
ncbi:unnamed protein product [Linum trigynum]|uniref:Uncharacterized protein n=1 Tax=Linum trigynum TaxID=586398 RepID=A0AAV2EFD9_9ROSI